MLSSLVPSATALVRYGCGKAIVRHIRNAKQTQPPVTVNRSKILQRFSSSSSSSTSNPPSKGSTSALRFQQRQKPTSKKKALGAAVSPAKDQWSVVGYSTAASYDLITLSERLAEQGLYKSGGLVDELLPLCLYANAAYQVDGDADEMTKREIFFFEQGSVVFWNVPVLERENVLAFLKQVQFDSYPDDTVHEESELMSFSVTESRNSSGLKNGNIILKAREGAGGTSRLEKYSFSNSIAASVKLGALEASLDGIIDSIEHLSDDMKRGRNIRLTREEAHKKMGEILALRHVLNLSSDLLDTPDFYWDREDLETLYHMTLAHLTVGKRTRVMNEKLSHCSDLMDLISTTLDNEHGHKLEWYIIILIMIEIVFEFLHFAERFI